LADRRVPALHAGSGDAFAAEWNVPQCRLRLRLDLRLARRAAAPAGDHESGPAFHRALELVVRAHSGGVLFAELQGTGVERALDLRQQLEDTRRERVHGDRHLLARVATREHGLRLLDVLGPDLE